MTTHGILAASAAIGLLAASAAPAWSATIYADTFNGSGASGLSGTTPGTRSGADGGSATATWSASNTVFSADGSVAVGGLANGSAVLPFTPQPGRVYTLGADVNTTAGAQDWIALGFEQSNATVSPFNSPSNVGFAWMLLRGDRGAGQGQTFLGAATGNVGTGTHDVGTGTQSLKVVLDTTQPAWTAQWFVNGVSVRGPVAYATNPTIGFVGFSKFNSATGSVDNFTLASVPEPGGIALAGLGSAGLLARRRRLRSTPLSIL